MHLYRIFGKIERHVGCVKKVVSKKLFDQKAFVTKAHDEVVDVVSRVDLHDVPQDRFSSDLDHGLGPNHRFLAEPAATSPGQNDSFQRFVPPCRTVATNIGAQTDSRDCPKSMN